MLCNNVIRRCSDFYFVNILAIIIRRKNLSAYQTIDTIMFMCQHAARYLANQDWVKNDSLKTVENTAVIPPLKLLIVTINLSIILRSSF